MNVIIANPIYDVVFKYLMEDNEVAKLLISSIIGEDIIHLEVKPQENTIEKDSDERTSILVCRLDFSAKIKTSDGHKIVLIRIRKATFPSDIMGLCDYVVKYYANVNNPIKREAGNLDALPVYAIYFLGNDLEICRTPVLKVSFNTLDVGTQKIVEAKSDFIELLDHRSWIVQISCMQEPRRNELELLLSVFDQKYLTSDHHTLKFPYEDFPEKYRPLLLRLKEAVTVPEIKEQMIIEDEVLDYYKNWIRSEIFKLREEIEKDVDKYFSQISRRKEELTKKDEELVKKEKELEKKDEEIVKKDQELLKKDLELEDIRKKNEALRLVLIQSGLL